MKTAIKTTLMALSLLTSLTSFAKVADFNTIIEENTKAQASLHTSLKDNLELARMAVQRESQEKYIVDRASDGINVPTNKGFLKFAKEKSSYRASESVQQKRLAQELSEAE
ncbi:MAG: hypothetical protein H7061_01360 [Bdellovibrionaceae bacterium]|nr:hypothetical protein [Bdellovibrio sp.]